MCFARRILVYVQFRNNLLPPLSTHPPPPHPSPACWPPIGTNLFLFIPRLWLANSLWPCIILSTSQHRHVNPEDGDSMFLRNFGIYLRFYTAPKPRRTSWKFLDIKTTKTNSRTILFQMLRSYVGWKMKYILKSSEPVEEDPAKSGTRLSRI
jgi:hypothetical protein